MSKAASARPGRADEEGRGRLLRAVMSKAALAATVLFVLAVPAFLIASNVRWVINAPFLYSYGFDKRDIPARTGIERGELLSAARQIRAYFNNDEELLDLRVVRDGVLRSLYNEREVTHMKDVKGLVQGVWRIQEATGAYLLVFAVVGFAILGKGFGRRLVRYLTLGGVLTLALVVVVGLAALVGFDRLFLAFHLVSFTNDLWQLDPRRDFLIMMFPEGFFFDATMWIAGSTVVEALLLVAVPLVLRWTGRRSRAGGAEEPIAEAPAAGR